MDETLLVSSTAPLGHCWGCGNRLLAYSSSDRCKIHAESEATIHEVRWGVSMSSNEFMRRLAKTSYDVFCGVQENTDPEKFISFSVQYRAALAVCSQEILHFLKLNDDIDEPKAMHLAAECELVQSLELIWHLAELIFIQAFPSGHLAYSLCNWFHVQSQEAADNARLMIEEYCDKSSSRPEQDERFWPSIITLVLQARPHEAASLMAIHSHANSRMLRSIRQLLVALPIASQARTKGTWGKTGAQFSQAWSYWQSECNRRLVTGEFEQVGGSDDETSDHVQLIISILSGCSTAWKDARVIEATGGPRGWYFRFVSFLFYTDQMVTVDGLCGHLNRWLATNSNAIPNSEAAVDEVVDDLVTSVFHLNLQQFVRTAGEKLSSHWLVAHFAHLLNRVYPDVLSCSFSTHEDRSMNQSGIAHTKVEEMDTTNNPRSYLTTLDRKSTLSLTEFFLVGYAESIASDPSLLSLALGYLDYCESGPERQSTLLMAHGVPTTTRAVNWLMSQAKSRGLHSTGEQLAKMATRRFLPLALSEASQTTDVQPSCLPACATLGWAMLARDHAIIHRLAERTLSRDPGFTWDLGGQSTRFPTVPTEVAEMAAIVLGFCKDRTSQTDSNNLEAERPLLIHLSPELAFLVRYAELQQCFTEGNAESAVDRLIDLLVTGSGGSGSIPALETDDQSECCAKVSTRLRLRLLSEVRHLLGKQCIRRDQVELLISALTELRMELLDDEPMNASPECDPTVSVLLSQFHVSLARELASTFLRSTVSNAAIQQTTDLF